jgi:hypothetical protein
VTAARRTWRGVADWFWALPDWAVALILGVLAAALYLVTAGGVADTPPDGNLALAGALIDGRIDVPWNGIAELAPVGDRWYVPFPPVPALTYVPLAALTGYEPWESKLLSHVMPAVAGGVVVGMAFMVLSRLGVSRRSALWIAGGLATSTLWWAATEGGTWYYAHVLGLLFSIGGMLVAVNGRLPLVAGLLLGLAAGCRLPMALLLPLFLYWYRDFRPRVLLLDGAAIVSAGLIAYNLARFGSPVDFGYSRIISLFQDGTVLEESWFADGLVNVAYIPRSIGAMLFSGYTIVPEFPYLRPSISALSLAISAPIYLLTVRAPRSTLTVVAWVTVALVLLPDLAHGSWGFWQYGYRFILDAVPALLVLLALAYPERESWAVRFAVVIGAAATAYGLWTIKVLNFVDGRLPFLS